MQKHILFTILSAIFIVFVGMGIIVPIIPIYAAELGATGFALGVIIAGFPLSGGLLQPVVGSLSDRHGKKGFLIAGLLIFSLVGFTYTIAASAIHLVVIRILHGAGSAMIIPIAMTYISEAASETGTVKKTGGGNSSGRYMGMFNIAIFAGIGGGPLLGGLFLDLWGKNYAFLAMALLSLLSMTLVVLFLPRQKRPMDLENRGSMRAVFYRMLQSRRVMGILLSRMSTMIIMVPTFAFLPLLMKQNIGASGTAIGMVIASRTLVNALLQIPFGTVADRWHKDRLLFLGSAIISIGMLAVPFAGSLGVLLLLFAMIGLGESIAWPTLGALAAQEGNTYGHGSMMGIFNAAMNTGLFVGAMGVGAMVDIFGISWSFYIVAAFLFLSTIAAVAMIRPGKNPQRFPAA